MVARTAFAGVRDGAAALWESASALSAPTPRSCESRATVLEREPMHGLRTADYHRPRPNAHREACLRRLRQSRPDLHRRVLAGELDAYVAVASLPSPSAIQEAKGLVHAVQHGTMTVLQVRELLDISPKEFAIGERLGLGQQLRRARTFRRRVLEEFEKLNGQR